MQLVGSDARRRPFGAAGRAKRADGAFRERPRLCHRSGPHRPSRARRGACRQWQFARPPAWGCDDGQRPARGARSEEDLPKRRLAGAARPSRSKPSSPSTSRPSSACWGPMARARRRCSSSSQAAISRPPGAVYLRRQEHPPRALRRARQARHPPPPVLSDPQLSAQPGPTSCWSTPAPTIR